MMRFFQIISLVVLLSGCTSIERLAIPDRQLKDPNFQITGERNDIDHSLWDDFLSRYTIKDNQDVVRVRYADVTSADHNALKSYIAYLSDMNTQDLSRQAALAYWVNLYNSKTVDVILDHYPVESIRDIRSHILDPGPWDEKRLVVNDTPLSLHDIEHGIIRPLWKDDPRIHYILNCAAAGCPNLSQSAYASDTIERDLDQGAKDFINNMRGVTVLEDGRVVVSKVFAWYREDYGDTNHNILNHLRVYASDSLSMQLKDHSEIHGFAYDWSLNDAKTPNTLKSVTLQPEANFN